MARTPTELVDAILEAIDNHVVWLTSIQKGTEDHPGRPLTPAEVTMLNDCLARVQRVRDADDDDDEADPEFMERWTRFLEWEKQQEGR